MAELKEMKRFDPDSESQGSKTTDTTGDSNYGSMSAIKVNIDPDPPKSGIANVAYTPDANDMEVRKRQVQVENGEKVKSEVVEYDDDDDDYQAKGVSKFVGFAQTGLTEFYENWNDTIWMLIYIVIALLFFAYFGYAMYCEGLKNEDAIRLLWVTILVVIGITWYLIYSRFGDSIDGAMEGIDWESPTALKVRKWVYWVLTIGIALFAIIYIIVEIAIPTPRNLISLAGLAAYILLFYIFSYNPARVKWRPVYWGLAIQFIFALLILRTRAGFEVFRWLGDRVSEFLSYSDEGAKFVFGNDTYDLHFFAFKVLPVIIYFSSAISILYYFGVMQFVIRYVARFLAMALGTSPTESLNAAGNIFIGQSEAPLMIRPFLPDMTKSEMHAVLTGGFATIAGSVMAAYILYEVPANHLLSASVMSAPAALAMSKLFYPETKKSKSYSKDVYNLKKGEERNFIEAASNGATLAIKLVANIAVNLIAFIALLGFVNATLKWIGHRVNLYDPELSFELICSYVFWPLSFLMGTDNSDCLKVGEMIGIKTFINEFVAYEKLGEFINNTNVFNNYINNVTGNFSGIYEWRGRDLWLKDYNLTLKGGIITERSKVISTYALCGFSNIGSMGIMLGALGAMAPTRKHDLSELVLRAMIAGNVACFMTACIAGLLYEGELA